MEKNKENIKQLVLYIGIAGISALINFVSRFGYNEFVGDGTSVVLAYFTGMFLNFFLSRKYVFKAQDEGKKGNQFIKFSLVSMVGLGVTWLCFLVSLQVLKESNIYNLSENILKSGSHIIAMGFGFLANFFGHKFVSFKSTGFAEKMRG